MLYLLFQISIGKREVHYTDEHARTADGAAVPHRPDAALGQDHRQQGAPAGRGFEYEKVGSRTFFYFLVYTSIAHRNSLETGHTVIVVMK